jgi:hypothetical protein
MNYVFFIHKINIQLQISLSDSHSITNSLFNITTSQASRSSISVRTCRLRLYFRIHSFSFFVLLLSYFDAFPPFNAGIPLGTAASNAVSS